MRNLRSLEGSVRIARLDVPMRENTYGFAVSVKEKAPFKVAAVRKALGRYTLAWAEVEIAGTLSKDDQGWWLAANGSGQKLKLANRPKRDERDVVEDLEAELAKLLAAGKTKVRVGGEGLDEAAATKILLAGVRAE